MKSKSDELSPSPLAAGWDGNCEVLHVARINPHCRVLGPGLRAVVWVQGCPLRCRECVVPEWLPFAGGETWAVADLARSLRELPEIEGLTFSGGEPMAQAAALSGLIDRVREARDLSCVAYSGFLYEQLRSAGSADQQRLLDRLDVLIDGPYLPERHTDLRWRGSDNQRVLFLTERYSHLDSATQERGQWLEMECDSAGELTWTGIPPRGFRAQLAARFAERGIRLSPAPRE